MVKKNLFIFNSASSIELIGGSQRSIDYIINNISKDFRIFFITWNYTSEKSLDYLKFKDYELIKIIHPKKSLFKFLFGFRSVLFRIFLKNLKKKDYVWSHSPLPFLFFKIFIKKNIFYLYSVHGPLITEINYDRKPQINSFFLNSIYKYIIKNSNKIIFNSNYTLKKSLIESSFMHKYNLIVEEILLDENDFLKKIIKIKKLYDKKNYDNGNFFILPRRLVKRTGVQQFLTELIKKKSFKKFIFYISGEGELSDDIKLICNRHKNLKFIGKVDQNLLSFLLFISKGIIIPSVEAEGFCIVAKEAKILNKKIFHTNQGGLKECLAGYNKQIIFNINDFNLNMLNNYKYKKKPFNIIIENDESFPTKLKRVIKN